MKPVYENKEEFPIILDDATAEKLVMIIKNGSVQSGIMVMKSLKASLSFRRIVKEDKKLDQDLQRWG